MNARVKSLYDLEYAIAGDVRLSLDLHLPTPAPQLHPTAVYFHGGGWARGSKTDYLLERIIPVVESGIAVASVSYRFVSQARWPAQLDDATAAVNYVLRVAEKYGLDPQRTFVWGASAGGHLASMLALCSSTREKLAGAVVWFPPSDLVRLSNDPPPPQPVLPSFMTTWQKPTFHRDLVGGGLHLEERLAAASPISYITDHAPPFLILHGDRDPLVPPQQSNRFYRELQAAGVTSDYYLIQGATHEDPKFHRPAALGSVSGFIHGTGPRSIRSENAMGGKVSSYE